MNKELIMIGATMLVLVLTTSINSLSAQNATIDVSNAAGNASAAVNDTASELGQNASDIGKEILNKTAEAGEKILGGAADVLSNISEEVKEGVEAK